jgi:hypothetical protein
MQGRGSGNTAIGKVRILEVHKDDLGAGAQRSGSCAQLASSWKRCCGPSRDDSSYESPPVALGPEPADRRIHPRRQPVRHRRCRRHPSVCLSYLTFERDGPRGYVTSDRILYRCSDLGSPKSRGTVPPGRKDIPLRLELFGVLLDQRVCSSQSGTSLADGAWAGSCAVIRLAHNTQVTTSIVRTGHLRHLVGNQRRVAHSSPVRRARS